MKAKIRKLFDERFGSTWRPRRQGRKIWKKLMASSRVSEGSRFGRLVALVRTPKTHPRALLGHANYWLCVCECGTEQTILEAKLAGGWCEQCANCEIRSPEFLYRQDKKREAKKYEAAKARCEYESSPAWRDYGGRGILFNFDTFQQFYECLGPCPPGKTLDRFPNNDGHYEEGNVRWATQEEQMQNTRTTKLCPKDVIFLRRAGRAGIRSGLLAKWFGVSSATVRSVQLGNTWANIEEPAPVKPITER